MIDEGTTVKVRYLGYLADGTVFDSTSGLDPLEYKVGSGKVISGFDEAVRSMERGDHKFVHIPAEKAFGAHVDDRVKKTPMYTLMPFAKDIQVGKTFYFVPQGLEDRGIPARVLSIDEGIATVDFNHPLAGKDLDFDIELVDVID